MSGLERIVHLPREASLLLSATIADIAIGLFPSVSNCNFCASRGGQIGAERFYRTGIRTTRAYLKRRGDCEWERTDAGNLYFNIGAGYGWKVGPAKNIRLEGQFILRSEQYVFQAAMSFGRWW